MQEPGNQDQDRDLFDRARAAAIAGERDRAIALYRAASSARPTDALLHGELGRLLYEAGALDDAAACLGQAIALNPGDAAAQEALGRLLMSRADLAGARAHLAAAVAHDPRRATAQAALGDLHRREGRADEAVAAYRAALALDPTNAALHLRLGSTLVRDAGRLDAAMECFRRVIALDPDQAVAHLQLGLAFWRRGDSAPALALAERAVRLDPQLPAGQGALGVMLRGAGRIAEAGTALRAAIASHPRDAEARFNLGACLADTGDLAQAVHWLEQAVALAPGHRAAQIKLGSLLTGLGRRDAALAAYRAALARFPDDPTLRLGATIAELPMIYDDVAQVERCRASYAASLEALARFFAGRGAATAVADAEAIGTEQPFFLAYQGRDDRALAARYGAMIAGVMQAAYPQWARPPAVAPPTAGEKIRVAIVSGHFWAHSVLKAPIRGWIALIDRTRFRVLGYHVSARQDGETAAIRRACDRFVQGPLSLAQWCETIRADAPHVVIFPELGMDMMTPRLAALRLAPIQCVSFGHPATSGFPTIDYYLSGELMEPEGAERQYVEKLVRLPDLGFAYVPPVIEAAEVRRESIGLRPDAVAFWCCQHLPKFLPQHDHVFARIARRLDDAQFVFIASPRGEEVTARFRRRLARAFAAEGLDAARHLVILPRLTTSDFAAVAEVCDVFLDSIGWSGMNTAFESLASALPIVTWPGPLMRGRHSLAILRLLDVPETVADSEDEYVEIAVRLGRDPAWRAAIRARMAANRRRVVADATPVRALEAWMEKVAGQMK
ncbi:MAG TPA: tetratricopeptide repeat protein [Xanthobacteraceae bacterium]|nr:tetratricopeptide repeat protein [Xanthobacteraceae bacterium]